MRHFMVRIACVSTGLVFLLASRPGWAMPSAAGSGEEASAAAAPIAGKVTETMTTGGYTYVQVDDGAKKTWAAAPQFKVAVGDSVTVPPGMVMTNFTSKTLARTFDSVLFVSSIEVAGGSVDQPAAAHGEMKAPAPSAPGGNPHAPANPHSGGGRAVPAADVDLAGIEKAKGGQRVADLFAGKADLNGKQVRVRGRVVKFSAQIMGKNWLHLQDGSGSPGTNDLVVSTQDSAPLGSLVVVSGRLAADKDLGGGYRYEVLVEDAEVTTE